MSLFSKFNSVFKQHELTRPVIKTPWGDVTESFRHQAALNMRDNPEIREKVEKLIGVAKAHVHYPEAYTDRG